MTRDGGLTWAVFFARTILGLIFFMAGAYKVFVQGPVGHAEQYFLPAADTFLPVWSLWAVGVTVPFAELVAGALVLVGWRTRSGLIALGLVLVTVTFGHLLDNHLFAFDQHVIPRLALVVFVLAVPSAADRWSIDGLLRRRSGRGPA